MVMGCRLYSWGVCAEELNKVTVKPVLSSLVSREGRLVKDQSIPRTFTDPSFSSFLNAIRFHSLRGTEQYKYSHFRVENLRCKESHNLSNQFIYHIAFLGSMLGSITHVLLEDGHAVNISVCSLGRERIFLLHVSCAVSCAAVPSDSFILKTLQ